MTEILIITHGNFGKSLLESCKLITGDLKNCCALGLQKDESVDDLKDKAQEKIQELKSKGDVIVLVDILGGSPSNVANILLKKIGGFKIIVGVNLPLLISLALSKNDVSDKKFMQQLINTTKDSIRLIE
ncbi:PTS sugar transporter subunit IIA [Lactobacillus sp. ESL0791]|uniref:PTS sugar transporter subunit IIA n=1 Tax=Lactobacillus sp. ESL0791 TaxID=2983234 RepID=UPI0023FA0D3B|nr:PTS sugar transporter subunit IIA [Lactobacillus sp. ESL0791]MDF7639800.1 PTS sugar transporter subunit IIA [Lactobacillus sp. ESL0791]